MKWTETILRWRQLSAEAQRRICWERIPRQVALSMAFEWEPVEVAWLQKLHRQGGATRYIQTTRGLLSYSQLAPLLAERVLRIERDIATGAFGAQALDLNLILAFH